jgi:dUTP pyrophosphatase
VIDARGDLPVQVRQLDSGLALPTYAHPGDAGADLASAEDVVLAPGERRLVGTGVAVAVPDGFAAFVHPRSGLAARHGITIVNAPGTVDAGYRGEIKVCLLNTDAETPVRISRGDRIAQLVIQPVARATFIAVGVLDETTRGMGGHGSTGGMPADADSGGRADVRTGLYAAEAEGVSR